MSIQEHDPEVDQLPDDSPPLLEVSDLSVRYKALRGTTVRSSGTRPTVDRVSLTVTRGRSLGLVGESGSGKSTLAHAVAGLIPTAEGTVSLLGRDLTRASARGLRRARRDLQMIFQDPYGSLNPTMTVRQTLSEPLVVHRLSKGHERELRVAELLDAVGLPASALDAYPREFSGGQRQRLNIARAIAVRPALVLADEPTSALDVSIQAQVLDLLQSLQRDVGVTYLFISHDLGVVQRVAQDVAVLLSGRIVEIGSTQQVLTSPRHPYTKSLVASVPVPSPVEERARRARTQQLQVDATSAPETDENSCDFAGRCPFAIDRCLTESPSLTPADGGTMVSCHRWRELTPDQVATAPAPVDAATRTRSS